VASYDAGLYDFGEKGAALNSGHIEERFEFSHVKSAMEELPG